jgi:hypothetical protein
MRINIFFYLLSSVMNGFLGRNTLSYIWRTLFQMHQKINAVRADDAQGKQKYKRLCRWFYMFLYMRHIYERHTAQKKK